MHNPQAAVAPSATAGKRRPGLIVVGVVLLFAGAVSGYFASYWDELADLRVGYVKDAQDDLDRAARSMRFNDSDVPKEEVAKLTEAKESVTAARTLSKGLGGGAGIFGLGGIALIAVGAMKRKS